MRVLAITAHESGASSFYRCTGPLSDLGVSLTVNPTYLGWKDVKKADIVFIQRPFDKQHEDIADLAKDCGKVLWIDHDDDMFSVPESNPCFKFFAPHQVRQRIKEIARKADLITVSTSALEEIFKPLNPQTLTVPNAYDYGFVKNHVDKIRKTTPCIFWRGTKTHDEDLDLAIDALAKFADRHREVKIIFMGEPYWRALKALKNSAVVYNPVDIHHYFKFIHELCPAIVFAPLVKNSFNIAKSNIAWIEATHAGSVCVGPDLPEWRKPGIINYEEGDIYGSLDKAYQNQFYRTDMRQMSRDYIFENLLLEKVNEQRANLLMMV